MAKQYLLKLVASRPVGAELAWIELEAPELSMAAQAGQFLLLRCSPSTSFDPLLRRPFYIAAADRQTRRIGLLCRLRGRGSRWLATQPVGVMVDALGPLGHPFSLDPQTRSLLLVAQGYGVAGLLLLAREALERGCAVTLLLADDEHAALPPFLLPPEIEYHTGLKIESSLAPTSASTLARVAQPAIFNLQASIAWADQLCAAVPDSQIGALVTAVQTAKYRWEAGFAQIAVDGFVACGLGACGSCAIETRRGWRLVCQDGPVFDLRDLR